MQRLLFAADEAFGLPAVDLGASVLRDWPMTRLAPLRVVTGDAEHFDSGNGWAEDESGGGWDMELDMPLPEPSASRGPASGPRFTPPAPGTTRAEVWRSQNPDDARAFVEAGDLDSAFRLLASRFGSTSIAPLRGALLAAFVSGNASLGPIRRPLGRASVADRTETILFKFGKGKLTECAEDCREALLAEALSPRPEVVRVAAVYRLACMMELARRAEAPDSRRAVQIACYSTHLKISKKHQGLLWCAAMNCAMKAHDTATARIFALHVNALGPSEKAFANAGKVLSIPESGERPAFDDRAQFKVCGRTFVPINVGSRYCACPHCGTAYEPKNKGELCAVCELGQIGFPLEEAPTLRAKDV